MATFVAIPEKTQTATAMKRVLDYVMQDKNQYCKNSFIKPCKGSYESCENGITSACKSS